jgi:hypothetical protein
MDWLQWPAMVLTILASYWVASTHKGRRRLGFWLFLASNLLWAVWGWGAGAMALVVLQFCLAALNIRAARKNDPDRSASSS